MKVKAEVLHSMLMSEIQAEVDLVNELSGMIKEILVRIKSKTNTLEAIEGDERPPAEVIPINKKEKLK